MTGADPGPAPTIPGYRYERDLGSGGFADVYLYEQQGTDQKVAIKVLRDQGLSASSNSQLMAEAKRMASLSGHRHIVEVKTADFLADGRPYLVMSYFPQDNLLKKAAVAPFSVAETLQIGVQVGSAVEVAHRAGILHRDIKPANILINQYDEPALTDFGIASRVGALEEEQSAGLSLPWSPPEAIEDSAPDVRSDVYSLAATLWHLLVGRSPFEVPGGDNGQLALMQRIRSAPVPSVGRGDAPPSLDRALRQAMAKNPAHRPASTYEFMLVLQAIERELRLPVTKILVGRETRANPAQDSAIEDRTRVRPVTRIASPQAPPVRPARPARPASPAWSDAVAETTARPQAHAQAPAAPIVARESTAGGLPQAGELAEQTTRRPGWSGERPFESLPGPTVHRPRDVTGGSGVDPAASPGTDGDPAPGGGGRTRTWVAAGVVALLVVAGIAFASLHGRGGHAPSPAAKDPGVTSQNPGGAGDSEPPGPPSFHATVTSGTAHFSWTYGEQLPDDTYSWRVEGASTSQAVTKPAADVKDPGNKRICIQIKVFRKDGSFATNTWSDPGCTP